MIEKHFRPVFWAVLSQFWTQKLAIFSQLEQCYAALEQLFTPTVIYKLKMTRNYFNKPPSFLVFRSVFCLNLDLVRVVPKLKYGVLVHN